MDPRGPFCIGNLAPAGFYSRSGAGPGTRGYSALQCGQGSGADEDRRVTRNVDAVLRLGSQRVIEAGTGWRPLSPIGESCFRRMRGQEISPEVLQRGSVDVVGGKDVMGRT